jgi:acetylornithine deacetylase ArgE
MIDTTTLLRDLVSLPSVNPMGRDLQGEFVFEYRVTDYLEKFFQDLGVSYERQNIAPRRDNIIARFSSDAAKKTILLEAHQDTVPTDNMSIDPWGAKIENGKLYGRGACDIKGGMAAMLTAFARTVREKPAGAANAILACTVDEEHTFLGVQRLVRDRLGADMAVVAEPTQLQIVHAHKGVVRWHIDVQGRSCHSSAPEKGVNAIYNMGDVLVAIRDFAAWLQGSASDALLGPPTLSVGRIDGGTSVNTVPDRCRIEIDRRLIPGEDPLTAPQDLDMFLRERLAPEIDFRTSEPWLMSPALSPSGSDELIGRLGAAIDAVKGTHTVHAVPYGTDASSIAGAGIPSVVFGPGDIAQAHTCDEWIALDEVQAAAEILFRLICAG